MSLHRPVAAELLAHGARIEEDAISRSWGELRPAPPGALVAARVREMEPQIPAEWLQEWRSLPEVAPGLQAAD